MSKSDLADAIVASADQTPTIIEVIIDQTGSMSYLAQPTIDAYNAFVAEQKAGAQGPCKLSLTKFSSDAIETPYELLDIDMVFPLDRSSYHPAGMTNLYDVIGTRISGLQSKLGDLVCNVVFLVITDGEDNTSQEYTCSGIRAALGAKMEERGWTFVYMGAHQRAVEAGLAMGFPEGNIKAFEGRDLEATIADASNATKAYRSLRSSGAIAAGTTSYEYFGGE